MANRDLFKNKYRIPSARAQWWNYGWNGAYFITICTQNREHYFGEIQNGNRVLSPMGVIADILWHEIPNRSHFVELGDFVVMPNHIHGILIIDNPVGGALRCDDVTLRPNDVVAVPVETLHATSLQHSQTRQQSQTQTQQQLKSQQQSQSHGANKKMSDISPKSKTVSTIIRSYKSAVTFHGNRLGLNNGWQPRFHDHIIRDDKEYQRISDYITTNPENWESDRFH